MLLFAGLMHSQEGWRLEHEIPNDKKSSIIFKGIVYNEMKGAFVSVTLFYKLVKPFIIVMRTHISDVQIKQICQNIMVKEHRYCLTQNNVCHIIYRQLKLFVCFTHDLFIQNWGALQ